MTKKRSQIIVIRSLSLENEAENGEGEVKLLVVIMNLIKEPLNIPQEDLEEANLLILKK